MNASTVGEKRIKDQSKVRNKTAEAISWSAFHAARQTQVTPNLQALYVYTASFFSPDCAHSVKMISHAIAVISKAVEYLSPGQIVVIMLATSHSFL